MDGLTLLVEEDHSRPVVEAVLRFRTGSVDDPSGRSGMAHLVEHLLFRELSYRLRTRTRLITAGTTRDGVWFAVTSRAEDLSEVTAALIDLADPAAHQVRRWLPEERAVITAEHAGKDASPMDPFGCHFPPGHPYRHAPIGDLGTLTAAPEEVEEFLRNTFGARRAWLAVVGAVGTDKVFHLADAGPQPPPEPPVRGVDVVSGPSRLGEDGTAVLTGPPSGSAGFDAWCVGLRALSATRARALTVLGLQDHPSLVVVPASEPGSDLIREVEDLLAAPDPFGQARRDADLFDLIERDSSRHRAERFAHRGSSFGEPDPHRDHPADEAIEVALRDLAAQR